MFNWNIRIDWIAVCSSSFAFVVYLNSFKAGFVYDDHRAILSNGDVLPESPWTGLWTNDFWGTPLWHSGSHKSFRPLATLSFRLNCYFSGFNPAPFHVTNVLLHTLTTWLFVRVARIVFRIRNSVRSARSGSSFSGSSTCSSSNNIRNRQLAVLVSSLLFACHPIHCEAVSGVVGRADVGATGFALAAFLVYVSHVKYRDKHKHHRNFIRDPTESSGCSTCVMHTKLNSPNDPLNSAQKSELSGLTPYPKFRFRSITYLVISILLAAAAMFTKEQGITILLVCATYDLLRSIIRARQFQSEPILRNLKCIPSVMIMGICFLALLQLRLSLMGGFEPPTFSKADNPTAHHLNVWTRFATFMFLPVFNLFLLVFPHRLSYDWSMESIPRVETVSDPRNIITVIFYFFLLRKLISSFQKVIQSVENRDSQVGFNQSLLKKSVCSVCWVDVTHHKCSSDNNNLKTFKSSGHYFSASNIRLSTGLGKTLRRNSPSPSAVGHCPIFKSSFSASSLASEHGALLLELAFLIFPFLPATNLFFYVGFVIAERVLYFPSVGFSLLVGHGFLILWSRSEKHYRSLFKVRRFLVTGLCVTLLCLCGRSVRRNEDWRDEEELYSSGISVNPPKSWGNLGNVFSRQGLSSEAEVAYRQALRFRFNMADVHYNLGLLLERQGRLAESLTSYRSAIHFRPLLASAYLSAGQVLSRQRKMQEAMELYERCFKLSDEGVKDLKIHTEAKVAAQLHYGRLLVEEYNDPKAAIGIFREAVKLMPPNFSQAQSVYNAMGEALSRVGEASEAERWFKKALNKKPDHIPAHLTYGKMLARNETRLEEAESWFRRAKRIAPADAAVYQHYGQFLASQGRHAEAAESFVTADTLTPNDYEIVVGAANGWRQAGDNQRAKIYYEKAVALRPQEARAHMNLGAILHLNRKYTEAQQSYLTALRLKPHDSMTLENLKKLSAYLSAGQVLTHQRKMREAMELFERCFKLTDEGVKVLRIHIEAKAAAQLQYCRLLVEKYDDPKTAISIYRQAVKSMLPNFSQAQSVYNAMGEALSRLGEASEAERLFKKALNTKPDHIPAHLTYEKMLARNETRLEEAESWFRRAKRIAPTDAAVYQHYGQFLASQGRHAEAAESFVTADALTPNDYEIVVGAANSWRQAEDNQRAEIYYEKAVALRPQEARAHMNLGAILHLNRKYAEAQQSYLTALHLKPHDSMTLENLQKLCQLRAAKKLSLSSCTQHVKGESCMTNLSPLT